jgi:hypothetical protein
MLADTMLATHDGGDMWPFDWRLAVPFRRFVAASQPRSRFRDPVGRCPKWR